MVEFINRAKKAVKKLIDTGFGYIFGSSVINKIIVFLSSVIIVRIIPKGDYGVYSYAYNKLSIFLLFSGMGISSGILQLCSEKYDEPYQSLSIFKYGSKLALGFNLILSLIIFIFAVIVPLPIDGAGYLLAIMSMLPIVLILYDLIEVYFRYNRLNKKFSYFNTINTLSVFIFSVIGSFIGQAKGLILFRYIGYLFTILLAVKALKFPLGILKNTKELIKKDKVDLIKISIISMFNNATGQLLYILDIFVIGLIIPDPSVIAAYKVATVIPNALNFIPTSLMIYLYPYFASHNNDKDWVGKNFKLITKYLSIFNLIITAILVIFAPLIIRIIFGAEYLDAVVPFRILSIAYFFSGTFRKISGNLLVTQRKLKFNFWLGNFEGIINIISNAILISYLGSAGAALTTLIISIVSSIISVKYFLKIINYAKLA